MYSVVGAQIYMTDLEDSQSPEWFSMLQVIVDFMAPYHATGHLHLVYLHVGIPKHKRCL